MCSLFSHQGGLCQGFLVPPPCSLTVLQVSADYCLLSLPVLDVA